MYSKKDCYKKRQAIPKLFVVASLGMYNEILLQLWQFSGSPSQFSRIEAGLTFAGRGATNIDLDYLNPHDI